MKKIYMVTGNPGKRATAQKSMSCDEILIEMLDPDIYNIIEPQSDTVEEIAHSKALQAYQKLGKPCVVEDSGFFIEGLNGFPGPYVKYMLETMGVENIHALSKNLKSLKCYFQGVLVYVDAKGKTYAFEEKAHGSLSLYMNDPHPNQWSDLWRIFTPDGFEKTLSEMDEKEHTLYQSIRDKNGSRWHKLRQHLLSE